MPPIDIRVGHDSECENMIFPELSGKHIETLEAQKVSVIHGKGRSGIAFYMTDPDNKLHVCQVSQDTIEILAELVGE